MNCFYYITLGFLVSMPALNFGAAHTPEALAVTLDSYQGWQRTISGSDMYGIIKNSAATFSPDGSLLAVAAQHGSTGPSSVTIWDINQHKQIGLHRMGPACIQCPDPIKQLAFGSCGGSAVLLALRNFSVHVHNLNGTIRQRISAITGTYFDSMHVSADQTRVLLKRNGDAGGGLSTTVNLVTGTFESTPDSFTEAISQSAYRLVASSDLYGKHLYHADRRYITTIALKNVLETRVAFSPKEDALLTFSPSHYALYQSHAKSLQSLEPDELQLIIRGIPSWHAKQVWRVDKETSVALGKVAMKHPLCRWLIDNRYVIS